MKWNKSGIVTDAARRFVVQTGNNLKNWVLVFLINFQTVLNLMHMHCSVYCVLLIALLKCRTLTGEQCIAFSA